MEGCLSHGCEIVKPKGMGTNIGKCFCLEPLRYADREAYKRVRAALREYRTALATAQKERDEAREALRAVEWVFLDDGGKIEYGCSWCKVGRPEVGHAPDCIRQRALGR